MNAWWITDQLAIRGSFARRPQKIRELQWLGVRTVISMLSKSDPDLENLGWLTYTALSLPNTATVETQSLWLAGALAKAKIALGQRVLIHCDTGRDRAAAAAAVTLHLTEGLSGVEAMERIAKIRPQPFRNFSFVEYLRTIPKVRV